MKKYDNGGCNYENVSSIKTIFKFYDDFSPKGNPYKSKSGG